MAVEVHKNFKAGLIESIKVAGQMIIDMAEDIAGKSDYISGLNVSVDFDPEFRSIPEITVTRSHVPSIEKLEYLCDIYDGKRSTIMKITNSNQINIKFKNRDHLTTDQVKRKPIMKGNEIVGVIDYADNYFIYGHLYNVEYSVSLEA